jgi:hypothetical protein
MRESVYTYITSATSAFKYWYSHLQPLFQVHGGGGRCAVAAAAQQSCKALKSTGNGNMKSVMFSNNGWIAQKSQAMRSGCPSITEISERKCGSDRRSGFFPRLIVTLVHCFHSPAWSRKRDSWQGKTFQNDFEAKSWLRLRRCPNFPQEENCQKLPTAVGYNDTAAAAAAGQPWGAYVYIVCMPIRLFFSTWRCENRQSHLFNTLATRVLST